MDFYEIDILDNIHKVDNLGNIRQINNWQDIHYSTTTYKLRNNDEIFVSKDLVDGFNVLKAGDFLMYDITGNGNYTAFRKSKESQSCFQISKIIFFPKKWWQFWKRKKINGFILRVEHLKES